jgi:hypothetical protein
MSGSNFMGMKMFAQVLDSAGEMAVEEQESLLEVLQHRVAERRRKELLVEVQSARREFKQGGCRPATPKKILTPILD